MNDMTTENLIEISFSGKDVKPSTVKASEIADILKAVENMVESQVFRDHPEIDKEAVIVSFVNIRASSVDLQFASPIPQIANKAFAYIGEAVTKQDYTKLPSSSFDALDTIMIFVRKRQCTAEFATLNGQRTVVAKITPDTNIIRTPMLTGETIIFGKVVRVGGRTPKVMVELVNGQTIYCDSGIDIARQLGSKLYSVVGLVGLAHWDAESLKMEQFAIKGLTAYEESPLTDAMNELAKIAGAYYSDINDVDKYIAGLRGSESEPK